MGCDPRSELLHIIAYKTRIKAYECGGKPPISEVGSAHLEIQFTQEKSLPSNARQGFEDGGDRWI
jgi:hypothetical protein